MSKFYITILILILLANIVTSPNSIDLSDKNPMVYCLKTVIQLTFDEVKEYLLTIQKPEEAEDLSIDDPQFSICIEQHSRDN